MSNLVHSKWMKMALDEAMKAYDKKEIPIGAIVVKNGFQCISLGDSRLRTETAGVVASTLINL